MSRTGELRRSEWGDPQLPGLVLIHSLGTDSTMWGPQLPALSARRRVVAVDLPGHGRSSAKPGDYRVEDLGGDVLEAASEAGLTSFDVCGISIGGLIGLWLGINAPGRVSRLIVCNAAARLGSEGLWSERIEAVLSGGMDSIREAVLPRWFAADFDRRYPRVLEEIEQVFDATDPVGYAGCCAALRDADLRPEVGRIDCPTLIIAGAEDIATPPEQAAWLGERIADGRVEVIPGAAHLSNLDQPEAFTRLVVEALDEPGTPSP